jgi:hypothetical protein
VAVGVTVAVGDGMGVFVDVEGGGIVGLGVSVLSGAVISGVEEASTFAGVESTTATNSVGVASSGTLTG